MLLASILRDLFHRSQRASSPLLSVVVNFHNHVREARNTLHSLTRGYQLGAHDIPYEVIALDHGSSKPLSEAEVESFGPEFVYRYITTRAVSPAAAINDACRKALGEQLVVIIDGAHILTPAIFRLIREAFQRFRTPFIATVPFHLGPQMQNLSVPLGYNQQTEDRLLNNCGWKENGYRLYSISGSFADASGGWYGQLFESGCFAMRKVDFLSLGGFDEQFHSPGGGLVNLDIFQRALVREDLDYVVLLGEGTFHQVHGGVATNAPLDSHPWKAFQQEYVLLRGHPFIRVPRQPHFLGEFPKEAKYAAEFSREVAEDIWRQYPANNAEQATPFNVRRV